MMRRAFTLLEVLLASLILGLGLTAILVSLGQSQKMMLSSSELEIVNEVMDLGDMAYPLSEVKEVKDLEVHEVSAEGLWETVAGRDGPRLTHEIRERLHGYYWERSTPDENIGEDDLKRLGNIYRVRYTVKWGDWRRGNGQTESYLRLWRKAE